MTARIEMFTVVRRSECCHSTVYW